jgi:hypothetical protein
VEAASARIAEGTMNIGIDARWLGAQGAGRYVSNMIRELQDLDPVNRFFDILAKGRRTPVRSPAAERANS